MKTWAILALAIVTTSAFADLKDFVTEETTYSNNENCSVRFIISKNVYMNMTSGSDQLLIGGQVKLEQEQLYVSRNRVDENFNHVVHAESGHIIRQDDGKYTITLKEIVRDIRGKEGYERKVLSCSDMTKKIEVSSRPTSSSSNPLYSQK